MTTKYHDPIPYKSPGYSYIINRPLGQLDQAIADADNLTDANGSVDLGTNDDFAKNHIVLGAGHMRVDTFGNLRVSDHAPQDDNDGTIVSTAPPPATGGDIVAAISVSLTATVSSSTFNEFTDIVALDDDNLVASTYKNASGLPSSALIYASTRPFSTWTLQQNFYQRAIYRLANLGGGNLIAGTSYLGWIFRSADSGATWASQQQLRTNQINNEIRALINLGSNVALAGTSNKAFPTAGGRIWKSLDAGVSWVAKGRPATNVTQILAFAVGASGRVIAAGRESGTRVIYWSDDQGDNWTAATTQPNEGTDINALATMPDGRLVAGTDGVSPPRIFTSDDNGAVWTARSQLSGSGSDITSILPLGGNRVIAAVGSGGGAIFESTDNGATWGSATAVGAVTSVNRLARVGGDVFAACSSNAIYQII